MEHIVICGGGIVGAACLYYLTERGAKVTLVERSDIACHASGKAGGFLARDWGQGATRPLHTESFRLHEELAKTLGIESYRAVPTLSVDSAHKGTTVGPWLNGPKVSAQLMDSTASTAQVTPKEITVKLVEAAKAKGATVIIGKAIEGPILEGDKENRKIVGVKLSDDTEISCTKLLITMGAWSTVAGDWFNVNIPMEGIKSTSIIFENVREIAEYPYALFCAEDRNGCHLEVYPRPNGEVYLCGLGGSDYVSGARLRKGGDCETPEQIVANPARVEAACKSLNAITTFCAGRKPEISQACMRPCPPDARPIMGPVPDVEGAYICAGHNCWGILWGPVSGLLMSELLLDGETSTVDISSFSLERFMEKKTKRGRHQQSNVVGEQW